MLIRIFCPKHIRRQATPKTVEIYGGSGLGLNISRKLCHVHGGEVGVSSKAGCGSTFGFFFKVKRTGQPQSYESRVEEQELDNAPLRGQINELGNFAPKNIDNSIFPGSLDNPPVAKTEDMIRNTHHQEDDRYKRTAQIASKVREESMNQDTKGSIASQNERKSSQDLRVDMASLSSAENGEGSSYQGTTLKTLPAKPRVRAHVLLVEDNVINQKLVCRKLENKGYDVTVANNGKEAVTTVMNASKLSSDKHAFDICLMDMEMPIMDGNTATKTIRELERQGQIEHIPILGVTANVRSEQQAEM